MPLGQARAEAERLAAELARFPQVCLRADRASAYAQWARISRPLSTVRVARAKGHCASRLARAQAGSQRVPVAEATSKTSEWNGDQRNAYILKTSMPDFMRIGGVTGWLRAAAVAGVAGVPCLLTSTLKWWRTS